MDKLGINENLFCDLAGDGKGEQKGRRHKQNAPEATPASKPKEQRDIGQKASGSTKQPDAMENVPAVNTTTAVTPTTLPAPNTTSTVTTALQVQTQDVLQSQVALQNAGPLDRMDDDNHSERSHRSVDDELEQGQLEQIEETVESKQFKAHQRTIHRLYMFSLSDKIETLDHEGLRIRNNELARQWEKASELFYSLIGQIDDAMAKSYDTCLAIMEEEYFDASAVFGKKISEFESASALKSRSASEVGHPLEEKQLKLVMPVHSIPNTWGKFDGNKRKWLGFRDRFLAAIHNNPDVSEPYKQMHLVQSLTGRAANTLGERRSATDSYQEAWERLMEVYNKPYDIARDHMNDFYALPVLQSPPTANELENMANKTHETIRQLRSLQYPVDTWDFVFVHALHERLDDDTAKAWEKARSTHAPTASEMLEFLDKEASASKQTRNDRREMTVTIDNERAKERPSTSNWKVTQKPKNTGAIPKTYPCEACPPGSGQTHPIYSCPEFLSLNPQSRKQFAMRRNLCVNCLKKGHQKDSCGDQRRCTFIQCRQDPMHNSLLCPYKQTNHSVNLGAVGGKST